MSRLGKYARIVGLAGGMGAIAWAMRDRMVSLGIPREPDRPVFRTPPTSAVAADDLTQIHGVGPVFARRLADQGIRTFHDISISTDEELAALLEIGKSRVSGWRDQAKALEA